MKYDLLNFTLFTRKIDAFRQKLYSIFTLCAIKFEISIIVPVHCIAIECKATFFHVQKRTLQVAVTYL